MCWKLEIFRREISVFTLSEVIPKKKKLFLARDLCVLQSMKCVKVMFVWCVFKELCKKMCGTFYNLFNVW